MFCHNCGKELQDGDKFCTYCGKNQKLYDEAEEGKLINDSNNDTIQRYTNKAKEAAQEVAVTAVSSAKALGEKINDVTDGKTNVYATMVKSTAQDFANNVQQATQDKNASNFYKKGDIKYIIFGLIMVCLLMLKIFGGADYSKELEQATKMGKSHSAMTLMGGNFKGKLSNNVSTEIVWSSGNKCAILASYTVVGGRTDGQYFFLMCFSGGEYMGGQEYRSKPDKKTIENLVNVKTNR